MFHQKDIKHQAQEIMKYEYFLLGDTEMNLKYSKDVVKDYDKLSDGRKRYIIKRAEKKGVTVSKYLLEKYSQ